MSQPPELPGSRRLKRMATRSQAGGAYEGAFEAVGAILIATLLGYGFDEHYGTTPTGVLVGAAIGFGAFVLRLVRLGRRVQAAADAEAAAKAAEAEARRGGAVERARAKTAGSGREKDDRGDHASDSGDGDDDGGAGVGLGLSDVLRD